MPAITIEQAGKYDGQEVTIKGWLYNLRESGKLLFPKIVKPTLDRDFLSVVLAGLLDGDRGHLARIICDAHFAVFHAFSKRSMDLRAAVSCAAALGASEPVFSFNSSSKGSFGSGAVFRSFMAADQSMEPS